MKPLAVLACALVVLAVVVLHACEDDSEVTQPSAVVAAVTHKLTITGIGTGNGRVTSSPVGIDCTITAGKAAATGCTKSFNQGVKVTLTAAPKPATVHAFGGWAPVTNSCPSATGTCIVAMGADHAVSARFRKGPFTVMIASGLSGGNGSVTTQPGLVPKINCTIKNGKAATTGCSATYAANVTLTLTATAGAGFVFDGWAEPTCGTGKCQIAAIQNRTIPAAFFPADPSNPSVEGRWEALFSTPVVAVHMHLLTTGKVLLWGDDGDARLWSTSTGFSTVPKPFRLYCSGHAFLPDGRLLVTGGTSHDTRGLRVASVFNPATSSWTSTTSMAQGRYYPTTTTLPNGDILAISGHDTALADVTIPEVWSGGVWRRLTTAPLQIPNPYYPDMFVAPNGQVFLAGFLKATQYLDVTGTGHWTPVADRNVADRTMGSAVMYAPGKILYVGGGDPPTASAEVIDLNQAAPSWRTITPMSFPRRQTNATLLADGTVLVTGGTKGPGFNDQAGAVHYAELWDPQNETWKRMAYEPQVRTYHSTALLLPSGRIVSSGSGEGGGIPLANSEFSGELFTPPYLFNPDGTTPPRPTITNVPPTVSYGQAFTVETPDAGGIARANLIRLSSVTHAFNQSQLIYPLTFTVASSTSLSATAPPNANLAPPGPYMLFLINGSGTPSVAKILTVGP